MSAVAQYLNDYAQQLTEKVEEHFAPLHTRGQKDVALSPMSRSPIGGQYDAIAAIVKLLRSGEKTANLIGELGVGKTFVSVAALHTHACGKPYRAVVMCPPHLTNKWAREILHVVPGARTRIIDRYSDLVGLAKFRSKPVAQEFLIISDSMAKLGAKWEPSVIVEPQEAEQSGRLRCPGCHADIVKRTAHSEIERFLTIEDLRKRRMSCAECGGQLWQWNHEYDRWPVASFIHKKLKGLIDYTIVDESHNSQGDNTMIAVACSKLIASSRHVITMTGTYINGYAYSIMHLLWRSSPTTLVQLGFEYGQTKRFAERYGRLERTVKGRIEKSNKTGPGSKGRTTVKIKPGIMPSLFGDHILNKTVFLSLSDISDSLPPIHRQVIPVQMDSEQSASYIELEDAMKDAVRYAMENQDWSLVTRLVIALIGYPDHPYGWSEIGYKNNVGDWNSIVKPRELSASTLRPKEKQLLDLVFDEYDEGRKCWVFCEMTQKRDVQPRIERLLAQEGLRVAVLRSQSVPTKKREQWIAANAPHADVMVSHPQLVETGLDFFSRSKRGQYVYNIPSLFFYQTGLKTSTLRQASGRAWRLGQEEPCSVAYLHYELCMQSRLMNLMSAKLQASEALDGKFSTDGLSALSNAGDSMGLALARQLLDTIAQQRSELATAS